jgi:hypothetical protein
MSLPQIALSVRQPWAHAIAQGWKPVENRSWSRRWHKHELNFRGAFCIHASTGMTRDEYEEGAAFIAERGYVCPPPADLLRGGIIGVADITGMVKGIIHPWFFGPVGLWIQNAKPIDFIPASGALGFFKWQRAADDFPPAPAKWMLPKPEQQQGTLL